jgi:hypothetical protein
MGHITLSCTSSGFAILVALYVRGAIFEKTLRAEPDWLRKGLIIRLMKSMPWLGPASSILLFLTGLGNIYNRYLGSLEPWHVEGWIYGKFVLFVVFLIVGSTFGRILSKRRSILVLQGARNGASVEGERRLRWHDRRMILFYTIQGFLLLSILVMSAFGSSKHPGVF